MCGAKLIFSFVLIAGYIGYLMLEFELKGGEMT